MPAGAVVMFRSFRLAFIPVSALALMSFTLPGGQVEGGEPVVYDVRRAFVAARADVSHRLLQEVHANLSASIGRTFRRTINPRVVLTVRLSEVEHSPVLFASWYSAKVNVKAASVISGEVVAVADFSARILSPGLHHADSMLAAEIAARISKEFRLDQLSPGSTLATALFP